MLSMSQDCPPNVGGVARPLEGWLNANPCRVRGAQCSVRRRTRKGAQRRGYYPRMYYHLPLFEGTPPTLGGEFKVLDNIYIITINNAEAISESVFVRSVSAYGGDYLLLCLFCVGWKRS